MVELKDIVEVLAVHRALMAARFVEHPSDPDLLGSTYLAAIHSSVVDEISAAYRRAAKFGEADRWDQWRDLSKERFEWDVVRRRLRDPDGGWATFSDEDAKREFLVICFEPFRVPPDLVDELIVDLDRAVGPW